MATTTPYKNFIIMSAGEFSGQWGDPQLNDNFIAIADRNLGGIVVKSLASADVTLTAEESQNLIVRLTGTLPTNRVVTATSWEGMMIVENLTSGSFTVTVTDGVAGTVVPQGARSLLIADTSNGTRIAAGTFATGTAMLFAQTTAPVGWTKSSSYNQHALRVVSGSASSGGTVDFTTAFASQPVAGTVGNTALTIAQMPLHGHPFRIDAVSGSDIDPSGGFTMSDNSDANTPAFSGTPTATAGQQIGGTGGGEAHTHSFTGTAINLAVRYLDVILAIKD